jgi:hypothetical protein
MQPVQRTICHHVAPEQGQIARQICGNHLRRQHCSHHTCKQASISLPLNNTCPSHAVPITCSSHHTQFPSHAVPIYPCWNHPSSCVAPLLQLLPGAHTGNACMPHMHAVKVSHQFREPNCRGIAARTQSRAGDSTYLAITNSTGHRNLRRQSNPSYCTVACSYRNVACGHSTRTSMHAEHAYKAKGKADRTHQACARGQVAHRLPSHQLRRAFQKLCHDFAGVPHYSITAIGQSIVQPRTALY